jgi:uncharacterized protein YbjT (DUF2867 family)
VGTPVKVLVTGITGYVGGLVAARLTAEGHTVHGFARDPRRATTALPVLAGDAVTGEGLAEAMRDTEVAYFLIHSMETTVASGDGFSSLELAAAQHFADAARTAGVRRIVYLGGPVPDGPISTHLSSRHAVERTLLEAVPASVALRASIVIGSGSRSFRLLVRLVERLPVLAIPGWGSHRTAPVDERDVLAMLVRAADADLSTTGAGHVFDAAGPDVVTYRDLLVRIADLMLIDRPTIGLGRLTVTPIASRVAAIIAGEDPGLIGPLMESLDSDLLAGGESGAQALGVRLHSLDAAIEHALREWEDREPLAAR